MRAGRRILRVFDHDAAGEHRSGDHRSGSYGVGGGWQAFATRVDEFRVCGQALGAARFALVESAFFARLKGRGEPRDRVSFHRVKVCEFGQLLVRLAAVYYELDFGCERYSPPWRQGREPLENASDSSFVGQHKFLIYRLFSLAGIVPIGGYVIIHLLTNATVVDSPATFQRQVNTIHSLGILLPLVEWTFIFLPMLFHAAVGWLVISGSLANVGAYPYARNYRYVLQRMTGMIAFVFILYHLYHLHHLGSYVPGGGKFVPERASSSTAEALAPLWVKVVYAIGTLSAVYHLANGIWTFGITWGIWTSERAMRWASVACLIFGIGLGVVGLSALTGMSRVNIDEARQVEKRIEEFHKQSRGLTPTGEQALRESGSGAGSARTAAND